MFADRDAALDGKDVLSMILFHRLFEVLLERCAAACAQHMTVLERNHIEHEIGCERRTRADERLVAACALVPVQPNDDRQRFDLRRLNDLREVVRAQPHE